MSSMIIFNSELLIAKKSREIAQSVQEALGAETRLNIAAVSFTEDAGSRLYSRLKAEAAERVGIGYVVHEVSILDQVQAVQTLIQQLNIDSSVTGIIVQKPWRKTWLKHQAKSVQESDQSTQRERFQAWWHDLVSTIDPTKDVDGLHPSTLDSIKQGAWHKEGKVLPATAQAVVEILEQAELELRPLQQWVENPRVAVVGRSDIVGLPVFYALQHLHPTWQVDLLGRKNLTQKLESDQKLHEYDIVISATGQRGIIKDSFLKPDSVILDVGEPFPDVEWSDDPSPKPAFLTPVPGGVGPVTVVCLLENCVSLSLNQGGR